MKRIGALLATVALAAASLAGCGLSSGSAVPFSVGPGSIKPVAALKGVPITVGSKDFTEQILLAYIAEYALEAAGMDVKDLSNISGSNSGRQALFSQQIDLMWEYTGTAWISYQGNSTPIADPHQMFNAVKSADAKQGIDWINLAPLNNTYALAQSQEVYNKYHVKTLSDLSALAKKDPSAATFCLESEFASRNDGFPGLVKKYGMNIPDSNIQKLDTGAVYEATAQHKACNFGEIFFTDARKRSLNLKTLDDDKKFFPAYNAAVTVRDAFYKQHPQIQQVLQPVADRLTSDTMLGLSSEVDVKGRDWADVAKEFMIKQGFVTNKSQ